MFKAPVVEDHAYYSIRRKLFLSSGVLGIFSGMLFSDFEWKFGLLEFIIIVSGIGSAYYQKQLRKLAIPLFGKRKLILDLNRVQIVSRNKTIELEIAPSTIKNVTLYTNYSLYQETFSDIIKEFITKVKANRIIFESVNSNISYDFEIDSYYMIVQLKKVLSHWKVQNINVEIHDIGSDEYNID